MRYRSCAPVPKVLLSNVPVTLGSTNGTWKLLVQDLEAGDVTPTNWSLIL